jgi:hypothetical protein
VFSVYSGKLFHSSSYGDIRVVEAIADWVKTDGFNESSLIKDAEEERGHPKPKITWSDRGMDIFLRWPIHTFRTRCFYLFASGPIKRAIYLSPKAALTLHYNPLLAFDRASSLRALGPFHH